MRVHIKVTYTDDKPGNIKYYTFPIEVEIPDRKYIESLELVIKEENQSKE